ncbi:MAG: NADP-dependent phosphogluconate dehydrogenase, partial [Chloroflexi bacterium]|nr:NADP-dependent phosphogluconate dehydrogenase [Chloroflexota bacterium]
MRVGLVGVGRMGGGIRTRLERAGHAVVAYDLDAARSDVAGLAQLVAALASPRVVWLMLPAGEPTAQAVAALSGLLAQGDMLVDGANGHYTAAQARAAALEAQGIACIDAGVSGGVWGVERGYCVMAGGAEAAVAALAPLWGALAEPGGFAHVGPAGAGHYVKMVHNAIEYGLMEAYAEGFALLRAFDVPLDLGAVAALWGQGSVVRSWLLELVGRALAADPELRGLRGAVADSGEGRWAVQEA